MPATPITRNVMPTKRNTRRSDAPMAMNARPMTKNATLAFPEAGCVATGGL